MTNSWGHWEGALGGGARLFSSPNGSGDAVAVCYYLLCSEAGLAT